MKLLKNLLLSALILCGGACATHAQEKTTTAGVPVVKLNNGMEMPRFGLGTFLQPSDEVCEQSCLTALKAGYRHIDTAHAYNDERGVGRAVKESGIPREEIWITSKLWPTEYGEGKTLKAIDEMLERMQLDYIDLLYVHQPVGDFVGAWKDMEKAVKLGKVRALGISMDRSVPWPWPVLADSSPKAIRSEVEGSLRRLQTDHIDLYWQHRIDPNVEPETVAETMAELIREGKICHWGISETGEDYLRRAHQVCPVAAVQNRYSMMARWHEALFPTLEELGIGLVAFSPLANGVLSECYNAQTPFDPQTDFRNTMPQFSAESFEQNHPLFHLLNQLADTHHATPAQVSLAWMLCKKPWIVPIPGTRKPERLKENAGAADIVFTPEEVRAIDEALDRMKMSEVFGGLTVKK